MAKFHINPETGDPGKCSAKVNCPFGDLSTDHYESKDEARKAYEASMDPFAIAKADAIKAKKFEESFKAKSSWEIFQNTYYLKAKVYRKMGPAWVPVKSKTKSIPRDVSTAQRKEATRQMREQLLDDAWDNFNP